MGVLENLEPKSVFRYFEEISSIPHGSRDTKRISDYCVEFAQKNALKYIQDEYNNVIIFKDASPGYEGCAPVMLQGHLDMVCVKEEGCSIDLKKDALRLQQDGKYITAAGTSLGGDDGIAIAISMAILESKDIPHPPIEAVFTVDEEIGMQGAAALDTSPLRSKMLINIDSEEEGHLLVSCAGGVSVVTEFLVKRERLGGDPDSSHLMEVRIKGLKGGHSGNEIDKGRANASILLGRLLYSIRKALKFKIVSLYGGLKDNAIPNEAGALIQIEVEDLFKAREEAQGFQSMISNEFRSTDPEIKIEVLDYGRIDSDEAKDKVSGWRKRHWAEESEIAADGIDVMDSASSEKIITALRCFPNGIQRMSFEVEGTVQTSLNLGILSDSRDSVRLVFLVRSSVESEKRDVVQRIEAISSLLDGKVSFKGDYPAWGYREDSHLREIMKTVFLEQYGREAEIDSIHAGVECGIFTGKIEGLDAVSFGPNIKDIHTSEEALDIESVQRIWKYILEVLRRIKTRPAALD